MWIDYDRSPVVGTLVVLTPACQGQLPEPTCWSLWVHTRAEIPAKGSHVVPQGNSDRFASTLILCVLYRASRQEVTHFSNRIMLRESGKERDLAKLRRSLLIGFCVASFLYNS